MGAREVTTRKLPGQPGHWPGGWLPGGPQVRWLATASVPPNDPGFGRRTDGVHLSAWRHGSNGSHDVSGMETDAVGRLQVQVKRVRCDGGSAGSPRHGDSLPICHPERHPFPWNLFISLRVHVLDRQLVQRRPTPFPISSWIRLHRHAE